MFVCPAGVKVTIAANRLHAAHSGEVHRSCSKEAHPVPPFPFFHSQPINAQKSFRMRTKLGKSPKTENICPHQIQLYHCSICEKVLAASKTVHKQFINSGACEKWCYMEVFSGNQVMRSDKASWAEWK